MTALCSGHPVLFNIASKGLVLNAAVPTCPKEGAHRVLS